MNTAIIIFKGFAYVIVGIFTPWSAALAQWIGTNSWPEKIVWVGVILPASAVGGASALLAFLSGSFSEYKQQKKADDSGVTQVVETKPISPAVNPEPKVT